MLKGNGSGSFSLSIPVEQFHNHLFPLWNLSIWLKNNNSKTQRVKDNDKFTELESDGVEVPT